MTRQRRTRTATGGLIAALALAVVPSTAGAVTDVDRRLELARAIETSWSAPIEQGPGNHRAAASEPGNTCFDDPEGDTYRYGSPPQQRDEPRADILEHCVYFGPTLSLALDLERQTNPLSDPNWNGATFAAWFIDINDDRKGDFFVAFHLDEDRELIGEVKDIRRAGEEPVSCVGTATYTSEAYTVSDIGTACIGGAKAVRVSPAMWYDTAPSEGSSGAAYYDIAPDGQDPNNPSRFPGPVRGGEERPADRLGGEDRIGTAVFISQFQFPEGPVEVLYLARSDVFIDAITGGILEGGPILLVPPCGTPVPQIVKDEIARLQPKKIIALGGDQAICDATLDEAADGRPTERLAGETRFETSIAISRFRFPEGSTDVYIARADVFADAVVAGILARGPVLLVGPCGEVPQDVQLEVERLDPKRVLALGGEVAVCDENLQAAALGRPTGRLDGETRIETAVAISRYEWRGTAEYVFLARDGRSAEAATDNLFADSAVGGILTQGPILLVPSCGELPESVGAEISRVAPDTVVALGGDEAICPEMLAQATQR